VQPLLLPPLFPVPYIVAAIAGFAAPLFWCTVVKCHPCVCVCTLSYYLAALFTHGSVAFLALYTEGYMRESSLQGEFSGWYIWVCGILGLGVVSCVVRGYVSTAPLHLFIPSCLSPWSGSASPRIPLGFPMRVLNLDWVVCVLVSEFRAACAFFLLCSNPKSVVVLTVGMPSVELD
jgi:hypothetical protein